MAGVSPTDETKSMFEVVNDELTSNLQSFMDSLPSLAERYGSYLETTKSLNPKSRKGDHGVLSPLLKRRLPTDEQPSTPVGKLTVQVPEGEDMLEVELRFYAKLEEMKPSGTVPDLPDDEMLLKNLNYLTCEAYELRIILSGVCDWIEMQMPAIKSEDNRGVEVQEAVIRHLVHMRGAVQAINERQRAYTDKVADYATKYYKNPAAGRQWARALFLWNHDYWDQLERDWRELRQIVLLAGRRLSLNMEKLTRPRGNTHHYSYM
eukprot:TRINITY_DN16201_c0_g1_i2.p1 TRINITY_DN16201_c0_g1~~TRINITY_DN16201_c0_g1_i2.p1  ORF type:complete len:263 (+),score=67.13 TRINITY_DN16201_c0_g1_i2:36-824(+)